MKGKKEIKTIGMFYHRYRDGGVERVMSLLMPIFQDMGYRVVLITEEEPTAEDYILPEGVVRYTISDTWKVMDGSLSREMRRQQFEDVIEKAKIDVVIYEAMMSPLAYEDIQMINKSGVYSIGCQHGVFCQELLHLNWNDELIKTSKLVDKLVVLSEMEVTYWKTYGVDAIYIYNPRSEFSHPTAMTDRRDIVWVGRLDAIHKRYMDIVDIMKLVKDECPDATLCVYGKGTTFEENVLRRAIYDNGLQDVIKLCGYITDVSDIYKTARIHLVTSASETFPMAIYESRCVAIPLVTYDMPYLELLSSGTSYISVAQGDCRGAADAIVNILNNSDLEKKLSAEAQDVAAYYTTDELKKRWSDVLHSLIQEDKKPCERDEKQALVLDTVRQHGEILASKYDKIRNVCRKLIDKNMLVCARSAKEQGKGIVIYPYGKEGKKVEALLKADGICVDYVIDQSATGDTVPVKQLNELEAEDTSRNMYIISSSNPMYYDEIRENLSKYVDEKNIYDMCPREIYTESVTEGLMIWW